MQIRNLLSEPGPGFCLLCASILKRLILLPRSLKIVQVNLGCNDKGGADSASAVYLGEGETLPFFREILQYGAATEKRFVLAPARLRRLIREAMDNGQTVVVELDRLLGFLLPSGGNISYPWVRQKVFLAGSDYRERKKKIEGTFGRKVRKGHYECELSNDRSEMRRFYEIYYLPHLERRFGKSFRARPFAELSRAVRAGFLLKVMHNGKWVAGAVCRAGRARLTALAFGMNWEKENEWESGALSAAYYHIFQWAEQNSIKEVDLLRSRPLTKDGVFVHKSRWGAIPTVDPWPHTQISFFVPPEVEIPPAIRSFLVQKGREFVQIQDCYSA
jgi:hypothetical protein